MLAVQAEELVVEEGDGPELGYRLYDGPPLLEDGLHLFGRVTFCGAGPTREYIAKAAI